MRNMCCGVAPVVVSFAVVSPGDLSSVQRGHLSCVQWLVQKTPAKEELVVSSRQASIDGSNMRPPLAHVAARYNQDTVLDWLCEQMTNESYPVDSANHHSNTAVHEAAARGHLKCLQTLVGRGASVTVLNSHGDTPGQVADKNGHDLCVGYLVVVETCMSLAQQLITVKLENEGIRKENNVLRTQVQVMHNAKLAQAKESVEERIRATLQSLSSYEEDNESKPAPLQAVKAPSTENVNLTTEKRNALPNGDFNEMPKKSTTNAEVQLSPVKNSHAPGHSLKLTAQFVASHKTTQKNMGTELEAAQTGNRQISAKNFSDKGSKLNRDFETLPANTSQGDSKAKENEDSSHEEVENLMQGMEVPKTDSKNVSKLTPQVKTGGPHAVRAWEKMAMDEVLRLARDSRYLPSPTVSMCTEDSTMETREVMRDRLAEASRWFLVQQSGGIPKAKDSMLTSHPTRPFHSETGLTKPQQKSLGNTPSRLLGVQRSKAPMRVGAANPKQTVSMPQSLVYATNQHYESLQQQKIAESSQKEDKIPPVIKGSLTPSDTKMSRGNGRHVRPTSAKSTSSNASTIRSNTIDGSSSTVSNSSNNSQDTIIEITSPNATNPRLPVHTDNDPLQKKQFPPSPESPISVHSRSSSRPNSAKRHAISPAALASTHIADSSSLSPQTDAAEVRVALPTRSNSFLRKVQPSCQTPSDGLLPTPTSISYPAIPTKSSPKRVANSPNSLGSHTHGGLSSGAFTPVKHQTKSSSFNAKNEPQIKKETTINGNGYAMWKPSSKGVTKQENSTDSDVPVSDSERSVTEKTKKNKSPPKHPYGGLFSSAKTTSKKKSTKLFHF